MSSDFEKSIALDFFLAENKNNIIKARNLILGQYDAMVCWQLPRQLERLIFNDMKMQDFIYLTEASWLSTW